MQPQTSIGVANQQLWPKAGDTDDCFALATMQAVLAVAPWERMPNIRKFRELAGNPDVPGQPDGGTIRQCAKAIRALWPGLGKLITVTEGLLGKGAVLQRIEAGQVGMCFVDSGELPVDQQYGFTGGHAIAVAFDGQFKIANPLAPAHSRWKAIGRDRLATAIGKFPGERAFAILMPLLEEAFQTHPLWIQPIGATVDEVAAAVQAGRQELLDRLAQIHEITKPG